MGKGKIFTKLGRKLNFFGSGTKAMAGDAMAAGTKAGVSPRLMKTLLRFAIKPVYKFIAGGPLRRLVGKNVIRLTSKVLKVAGFGRAGRLLRVFMARGGWKAKLLMGAAGIAAFAGIKKLFGGKTEQKTPDQIASEAFKNNPQTDPTKENALDKQLNTEDNYERFQRLQQERQDKEADQKAKDLKIKVEAAKNDREKAAAQKIDPNDLSTVDNKNVQMANAEGKSLDAINERLDIIDTRLQTANSRIKSVGENVTKINKSLSDKLKGVYHNLRDRMETLKPKEKEGFFAWIARTIGTILKGLGAIGAIVALMAKGIITEGISKLKDGAKWLWDKTTGLFGGKSNDKGGDNALEDSDKELKEVENKADTLVDGNAPEDKEGGKYQVEGDAKDSEGPKDTDGEGEEDGISGTDIATAAMLSPTLVRSAASKVSAKVASKNAAKTAESVADGAKSAKKSGGIFSKAGNWLSDKWSKGKKVVGKAWGATGGKFVKFIKKRGTKLINKILKSKVGKFLARNLFGTVAKVVGKGALKTALKRIPILGVLTGLGFAIPRAIEGDWVGAAMEVASGAASLLDLVAPGAGTVAGLAIDAASIHRDIKREEEMEAQGEKPEEPTMELDDEGHLKSNDALFTTTQDKANAKLDKSKGRDVSRIQAAANKKANSAQTTQRSVTAKMTRLNVVRAVMGKETKPIPESKSKVNLNPGKKPLTQQEMMEQIHKDNEDMKKLMIQSTLYGIAATNTQNSRAFTINGRNGDQSGTSM